MRTATTSRCSDERGFTLVELMVTAAVMAVIVAATLSMLYRAFSDTGIIQNRRDVLGDGRIALQRMTKQIRQATEVNNYTAAPGDATSIDIDTFVNGTAQRIVWRTQGSATPYRLQLSMDGGVSYHTVLSSLASPNVFTYTEHDGVLDQVTVTLDLGTKTTTVRIRSDVELRNASEGG